MRDEGASVSTGQRVGDVRTMVASFRRHLRAGNVSERTIQTYLEACMQLAGLLEHQGIPVHVRNIRGEHVEAFVDAADDSTPRRAVKTRLVIFSNPGRLFAGS